MKELYSIVITVNRFMTGSSKTIHNYSVQAMKYGCWKGSVLVA